jgi:hypothetical protein|tara:strand:+ start:769 stop:984 length:216 start_codon:yes stop_codon:yes gene_type:complete
MGNRVPHKTIKHIKRKIRLLYKKPPSLDVKESILLSDFNRSNRLKNQYPVNKIKLDKKLRNNGPRFSAVNE